MLVAFNQLKHALCSRVLRDHCKMGDGLEGRDTTFRFIEEVHNCPDLWDISSPAYKDTKNKGGISADIRFRPKLSIFPALSFSSPAINIK